MRLRVGQANCLPFVLLAEGSTRLRDQTRLSGFGDWSVYAYHGLGWGVLDLKAFLV